MTQGPHPTERVLSEMTISEKIGQMTQVSNESITPDEVAAHTIGSVLSGGDGNPRPNTPSAWVDMVGAFTEAAGGSRLGIPLLYGVDAVHGLSNVGGATVFPHNIGLGAAADPRLVERLGRATATEMQATGVRWTFAPTVAVPRDIRWGRTYEGYGGDPELVASLGAAAVHGIQGRDPTTVDVLACAKHFIGDGATSWGTAARIGWAHWWDDWGDTWQIDQGDARIPEDELRGVHLPPYRAAIEAGVLSVMASYSSWNGAKLHSHRRLLTDVLKGELGFGGFVVSDWMGVDQVAARYEDAVVAAVNAGIDMVMVPNDFHRFIEVMTQEVASGRIPLERVDDAVRRILTAKAAARLFEPELAAPPITVVGSAAHRAVAGEAVRRGAVLLKNDRALPLSPTARPIDVAGTAADDVGLQCGGWTVGWQGGAGPVTAGTTLLDGLRDATGGEVAFDPSGRFPDRRRGDLGIVCVAEQPYAEGPGDRALPTVSDEERAVFARMRNRTETLVLVVYSGRPLVIPDLIQQADAVVAAWLPGSEGAALGELLAGRHRFEGRTPQPWPRSIGGPEDPVTPPLYPIGHGLDLARRR